MEPTSKNNWCKRIGKTTAYVTTETLWYKGSSMPAGHVFDLSVPWALRWIVSPHNPKLLRMAAWHDWWLKNLKYDRGVAAAEARLIARADGVEAWYSHVLHLAMLIWTAYD